MQIFDTLVKFLNKNLLFKYENFTTHFLKEVQYNQVCINEWSHKVIKEFNHEITLSFGIYEDCLIFFVDFE